MHKTQTHVRSYPLSFFQQCPILSMRPLIFAKLFTVSDIRRLLQDDEIEDYDDDYDYDYDHNYLQDSKDYSTNFNAEASNCEKTVHETSLLESNFISRNPLIGNNFVAIKNSVVKCVPLVEVNPPIADLADKLLLLDINSL